MLFNSIDFAIFLPIVFVLYWFVFKNIRLQNVLIVAASYTFYGWWDARFLGLILFSTVVDFYVGKQLAREDYRHRKLLLWISLCTNLGMLGFFKYYNFFAENFAAAFTLLGADLKVDSLEIILPVGISFYTFQTLSYTIDIYRRRMKPTSNFITFAAFVSFFPQLVAGPIERASNLLPQFHKVRVFDSEKARDGMRQILWGLFKKLVIADNCAMFANTIFNNTQYFTGSGPVFAALFFTFQIYCDFSGYSDIAIGTSRLFGFDLKKNFAFPYFSRDVAEFWRRWHISLSTWFRDYLYIPLGGSRGTKAQTIRNIFIIFMVSGFWHGANWTFIIWGALNALYMVPLLVMNSHRTHLEVVAKGKLFPSWKELGSMIITFALTVFAWIFFRAKDLDHALDFISRIFTDKLFTIQHFETRGYVTMGLVVVFVMIEWIGRENEYAIEKIGLQWSRPLRWAFYTLLLVVMGIFIKTIETPFIYFQF